MSSKKTHYLYATWVNIRQRCYNRSHSHYKDYGERGIAVCELWRTDFWSFADSVENTIGKRPTSKHTLDRKDNDGDYEPDNIRWATPKQQADNRRNNVLITAFGSTLTLERWAKLTGISIDTLRKRVLKSKWSPEKALTTPTRQYVH